MKKDYTSKAEVADIAISVIIPALNAEKTIQRCIQSVQNQSFTDYEVIVVDDGSTDNTAGIVSQICTDDSLIHLYSQSNKGVSYARNTALSYATGKYIMFIDSDDYVADDYLQTYYDAVENNSADVVIGGCKKIDIMKCNTTKIVPPVTGDITQEIWDFIAKDMSVFGFVCSKIFKRDLIENNNIRYNESMYSQEDLNFNLNVYDKANKIIAILDTGYIYEYRKSNRKPDPVGYINNQLKLLNICRRKQVLTEQTKSAIRSRLESYCFGYLMHSDNRKQTIKELHYIEGLTEALQEIQINNEKDYVCWLFSQSYDSVLIMHFFCRNIAKKVLGRGK